MAEVLAQVDFLKMYRELFEATFYRRPAAVLLHILYKFHVFKRPITKILEPFLECEEDLECILSGSSKDGRRRIDRSVIARWKPPEMDIMMVLNKNEPVRTSQATPPVFYYFLKDVENRFPKLAKYIIVGKDGSEVVNSQALADDMIIRFTQFVNEDVVFIKKKDTTKSNLAITLRIKTDLDVPKFIDFDLIPTFLTNMSVDEDEEAMSKWMSEEQSTEMKRLSLFIVPKSSHPELAEWRISYSLQEEAIFDWFTNIWKTYQDRHNYNKTSALSGLPSFFYKLMYMHFIIGSQRLSLEELQDIYLPEIVFRKRLPHLFNSQLKMLDFCITQLWRSSTLFEKEEDNFVTVKDNQKKFKRGDSSMSARDICSKMLIHETVNPVHWAAMNDSFQDHPGIDEQFHGMTPLFVACLFGHVRAVEQLISSGADVHLAFTNQKITSLHIACWENCESSQENFFKFIPHDIHPVEEFPAVLRMACTLGEKADLADYIFRSSEARSSADYLKIIDLLIKSGADVNCLTVDGISPLYLCAQSGDIDRVKLLIDRGAMLINGRSALFVAVLKQYQDIVKYLLQNGADVNADQVCSSPTSDKLATNQSEEDLLLPLVSVIIHRIYRFITDASDILFNKLNSTFVLSGNPLIAACTAKNVEIVDMLLQHDADVIRSDNDDVTALWISCYYGNFEIVKKLVRKCKIQHSKKEVVGWMNLKDNIQFRIHAQASPLNVTCHFRACHSRADEIVEFLLKNGADVNSQNFNNVAPLHLSCNSNRYRLVELLLDYNAQIDIRLSIGDTPLVLICRRNFTDILKLLCSRGADVNAHTIDGRTGLIIACEYNYVDTVQVLIDNHVDINATCDDGTTALFMSCKKGCRELVELLVKNGAVVDFESYGITPLCVALFCGHLEIAQSLVGKHGADFGKVMPYFVAYMRLMNRKLDFTDFD